MSQLTPISVIETALLDLRSEGYTHGVNGNATHPFGEQEKKHNWILRHPMRIVRLKRGKPFQVIANVDILVVIGIICRFCIQALKEIVILLAARKSTWHKKHSGEARLDFIIFVKYVITKMCIELINI